MKRAIYELIGRIVVAHLPAVVALVRWRYRRELRIAAAAGAVLAVLGVGAFLASRDSGEDL